MILKRNPHSSKGAAEQSNPWRETEEGGDKEDREDEFMEHTNSQNQQNSRTNTNSEFIREQKPSILSKRPIIFICDDSYSKGLKPLKNHCHQFKLEKNNSSLMDRLKEICRLEVRRA